MDFEQPVIIGVGEVKNRSAEPDDAVEPLELMLQALKGAIQDSAPSETLINKIISDIDSLSVVASSTWPYKDLPTQIAQKLGAKPAWKVYSGLTGNSPVEMVDDIAQRIAKREAEVGVVVGGEAFASWLAKIHRIGVPMQIYPLYENGRRARLGQTIEENHEESAALYGKFAQVAAMNPMSWNYGKEQQTAESIGTITGRNRMICFPYPLLMNAFNDVNLASACLMTSRSYAEKMGIPKERWIYPIGAGRGSDTEEFWKRANFHSSPAIQQALDMALDTSELQKEDIDIFDFYSCFPIVPKLACEHLGIPLLSSSKPITLLGGLTSFGGAGANYSMHAMAEMVRQLRQIGKSKHANGLILANGGVLTYENAICFSSHLQSSNKPYPHRIGNRIQCGTSSMVPVSYTAEGEVEIETYTVEYDRQNNPKLGHIICRLKSNHCRVVANHADDKTLERLASRREEPIGRYGYVWTSETVPGQNLFSFDRKIKL
ncbi:hypothetical protein BDV59DRAFT_208470 [Aspergillus ambiguus]|uniref:uncharacterized protein n=1 Tax=Aspergillus ambiguus TaxID=176160 RepID=UPI003CCCF9FA